MPVDREKLREAFSRLEGLLQGREFAFCTHKQADIDALASAAVLARHFPSSRVAVPKGEMNSAARALAERFSLETVALEELPKELPIVAVDTSSVALLPVEGREVLGIIDHHRKGPDTFEGKVSVVDPDARATAEIVAIVLQDRLDATDATLLASAIISDTLRFITATERTLDTFISLYKKSSRTYEELLNLAFPNMPIDEKKAVLNALKRLDYEVCDGVVISTSITSMKNGTVADLLIQAGDIAFVGQYVEDEGATRVSARASPHVDVPLNEVMAEVAASFNGKGGGHRKAAGCIAYGNPEDVLSYCKEVVKRYL